MLFVLGYIQRPNHEGDPPERSGYSGDMAEAAGRNMRGTRAAQRVDAPEMSGNDGC